MITKSIKVKSLEHYQDTSIHNYFMEFGRCYFKMDAILMRIILYINM